MEKEFNRLVMIIHINANDAWRAKWDTGPGQSGPPKIRPIHVPLCPSHFAQNAKVMVKVAVFKIIYTYG